MSTCFVVGKGGSPSGELVAKALKVHCLDQLPEADYDSIVLWGHPPKGVKPGQIDRLNVVGNSAEATQALKEMDFAARLKNGITEPSLLIRSVLHLA